MSTMTSRSSIMLNFRVKSEFAHALDAAARRSGMTRSDFIRSALVQAVHASDNGSSVVPARPKAPKVHREVRCPHPKEALVRTPYGVKICQSCGSRLG